MSNYSSKKWKLAVRCFKGLELSGIGKTNGWRIVFLIACFSILGYHHHLFILAIVIPHEKNRIYKSPLNIFGYAF